MQILFADGLGSVSINSGVVRLEFGVQDNSSKLKDEDSLKVHQAVMRPSCMLNIPVQEFANMIVHLQGLVEKLEKDGVLKRQAVSPTKI